MSNYNINLTASEFEHRCKKIEEGFWEIYLSSLENPSVIEEKFDALCDDLFDLIELEENNLYPRYLEIKGKWQEPFIQELKEEHEVMTSLLAELGNDLKQGRMQTKDERLDKLISIYHEHVQKEILNISPILKQQKSLEL